MSQQQIQVIDSHTGGEPTRLVMAGGPDFSRIAADFAGLTSAEALRQIAKLLQRDYDHLRRGLIGEPRCSEHWVGAWLLPAMDPNNLCGVIFFNNVGYLGMCGHGTMGLLASLAYAGRIRPGKFCIETPVGLVDAQLLDDHQVRIGNVPSFLYRRDVCVPIEGRNPVVGNLAWGGNWFFLAQETSLEVKLENVEALTRLAVQLQASMQQHQITGPGGQPIDHVELLAAGRDGANARNFVLCPGGAYDRSPCGTGTSAKVACLAAEGQLRPGELWIQESITGSRFSASYQLVEPPPSLPEGCSDGAIAVRPEITGWAYVSGKCDLVFEPRDPFRDGIKA
jgi:4-hydroxyproline epimerase